MDYIISTKELKDYVYPKTQKIVEDIREYRSTTSFDARDVRLIYTSTMQKILGGFAMSVYTLYGIDNFLSQNFPIDKRISQFQLIIGNNKEPLEKSLSILEYNYRLSFITLIHFQIEQLFKDILFKLISQRVESCKGIITKLFSNPNPLITLKDNKLSYEALLCLGYIRNTLHSNGFHTKQDVTFSFNGLIYEFKAKRMIECASWEHILELVDFVVQVVIEMLNTEKINLIKLIAYDEKYSNKV